jgi:hypothetical protein
MPTLGFGVHASILGTSYTMSHTSITKANATKVRNAKRGTWDVLS